MANLYLLLNKDQKENLQSYREIEDIEVETGTLLLRSHTVGDTTIAIDGFGLVSKTKVGDFINFGHTKVYMVADVTSPGAATVTIEPPTTVIR